MKSFYDLVRPIFPDGKLTQRQVDGMNATLAGFALYGDGNINTLAYCLATEFLETGSAMQPIVERGNQKYFDKYEPGTPIGKRLGNTKVGDGFLYRGRGKVQITGRDNYRRVGKLIGVDLEGHPERALESEIAVRLLLEGSIKGWYTGVKLSDFIDLEDESDEEDRREFILARKVINGTDKAAQIAETALVFERALKTLIPEEEEPRDPIPTPAKTLPAPKKSRTLWPWLLVIAALGVGAYFFFT